MVHLDRVLLVRLPRVATGRQVVRVTMVMVVRAVTLACPTDHLALLVRTVPSGLVLVLAVVGGVGMAAICVREAQAASAALMAVAALVALVVAKDFTKVVRALLAVKVLS